MATKPCGVCNGSGRIKYRIINPPQEWEEACSNCDGTGQVYAPDPPPEKKLLLTGAGSLD